MDLSGAGLGGQPVDHVVLVKHPPERCWTSHISLHAVCYGAKLRGELCVRAVDLREQSVNHGNVVALPSQSPRQMGADESSPPDEEHPLAHAITFLPNAKLNPAPGAFHARARRSCPSETQ